MACRRPTCHSGYVVARKTQTFVGQKGNLRRILSSFVKLRRTPSIFAGGVRGLRYFFAVDFVGELASDRDRLLADLAKTEARLAEARAQLDAGGLTAIGSRGQPRPSPLVAIESGLVP
jgi:hypothetical protein